ncbi:MAG TPA: efflux RND transporter periplasmic adaptor subunit [Candidatus Methylomirabilis sp.]|nr:efflux RND transporter periplasmic adaptor subunit [Candidatus Methylomirabilis sp.]
MRRGTQAVLLLGVVIAGGVGMIALLTRRGEVPVRVATLKREDMVISVSATATGTVESETEVSIRAEVPGRILRLLVDEGDHIARGQVVAELDPQEADSQLALARADLAAARARFEEEQAGVAMLRERVRTKIEETRATMQRTARDLDRLKTLHAEGAIARQQLDLAQADSEVAAAGYAAALADRDQVKVKEHQVVAAQAAVTQREAQLRMAEVQRSRMTVHSPIAGLVTHRLANEGEVVGLGGGSSVTGGSMVTLGGPLFTLVDPGRLYIRATVDEFDARQIRLGQEARVTLETLPGRALRGRLYKISPVVSGERQEARTFSIRVALEEGKEFLKPGMSADVEVIVARRREALSVPTQAILEREGKKRVYVVVEGKARAATVRAGENNWSATEILEGLREGDRVVVNPDAPGLAEGVRLRVE